MSKATLESTREFLPLNIAVLAVSDTRNEETDSSGQLLRTRLGEAGHRCVAKRIVADDVYQIRALVSGWIADPQIQVVLITGGTGLTGRDGTPEALMPLLDKTIDGFGELFRSLSYQKINTSTVQSRALAGVANGSYLFSLPGSSGACALAWDSIIRHQLDYRTRPCNLAELIPRLSENNP
ncbi:MAG: molybdenum cofactor biosynthesis protein B [Gammaproteobacteria bacterium]